MAESGDFCKKRGASESDANRRATPRCLPSGIPSLKSMKIADHEDVRLLNISRGGALFESEEQLTPGTTICLRLVATDAVFLLRARVIRCRAAALRDSNLYFESAVTFAEDYLITSNARSADKDPYAVAPVAAAEATSQWLGQPVTVWIPRTGPDLRQIFGLNNW